jgi:hypothetical protein
VSLLWSASGSGKERGTRHESGTSSEAGEGKGMILIGTIVGQCVSFVVGFLEGNDVRFFTFVGLSFYSCCNLLRGTYGLCCQTSASSLL